jgi:hypothetical protein
VTGENLEKTEKAALQAYEQDLHKAISCIADVTLYTKKSESSDKWLLMVSPRKNKDVKGTSAEGDEDTDLIMLRCKDQSKIYMELDQHVKVVKVDTDKGARFRVSTLKYVYAFYKPVDDAFVGWHFHPELEGIKIPHMHIYDKNTDEETKAGCKPHIVHNMHLPSGRVSLEDVIAFAIYELNVLPDKKRQDDWGKVLTETSARFEENKTWGTRAPKPGK